MSTGKEVTEIQVLTEEQIKALPLIIQENVIFLTEQLGSKELSELNPMVIELLDLRKTEAELVLMPLNEEGKFNKENIQNYTNLKTSVGKFNAKIKVTAKTLKKPQAKIQKGIIAIEKTFLSEASKVKESVIEKFAVYEADKLEKAKIAQQKKNQVLLDQIAKENKEKKEAQNKLNKTTTYNTIKYELINKQFTEDVSDAVLNANEDKLKGLHNKVSKTSYEKIIGSNDVSILDLEVQTELKDYFNTSKTNAILSIDARIKAIKTEKENAILEAKNETIKEVHAEVRENPIIIPLSEKENNIKESSFPPPPKFKTIESCINNIEYHEYHDDNENLNQNVAWLRLKEMIKIQENNLKTLTNQ